MADGGGLAWWQLELRRALQALAMPADVQRALFPGFLPVPVALLDSFVGATVYGEWAGLPAPARALVATLDARLRAMRALGGEALWTDDAFGARPEWAAVRRQATEALRALGWEVAAPPQAAEFYDSPEYRAARAALKRRLAAEPRERPHRAVRWPWEALIGRRRGR
jgi:hypothetical protein